MSINRPLRPRLFISILFFACSVLLFSFVIGRVLPNVQIASDGLAYLNHYSGYIGGLGMACLFWGGGGGIGVGARVIVMTLIHREQDKLDLVCLALTPFIFSVGSLLSYFYVVAYFRSVAIG
jgi:hypothetical protein